MTARILATALAGLTSVLGLPLASRAGDISNDTVVSLLRSEVSRRSEQINLAKAGAEWDDARVIGPYTSVSALPPPFAHDSRVVQSQIDRRDDIVVLAFLRGGQVASVVQVPRAILDLSPLSNQIILQGQCIMIATSAPPRAAAIGDCT
jgi:hypothetical protein